MKVFTGATGFLGKQVLGRLLVSEPNEQFILLIRGKSDEHVERRVKDVLSELFGDEKARLYSERVKGVAADISLDNLGLGQIDYKSLAQSATTIFHCAAHTALNQEIDLARYINVGGTTQILKLAKTSKSLGNDPQLFHVSTAYVAGDTNRVVSPDELSVDKNFRNAYERSKAESELLVRAASTEIKTCTFRPSIIVGDSFTGQTSAFNVLYVPARFVANGLLKALPAIPNTPFDIVPIDYVADAMVNLSQKPNNINKCYHLSSGVGRETSPMEILDCVIETLNKYRDKEKKSLQRPPFLPPEGLDILASSLSVARTGMEKISKLVSKRVDVIKHTVPFVPYMVKNPQFDTSLTIKDLDGTLDQPPLFAQYAERVFKYCIDTNWGRHPWTNPNNLGTWFQRLSCA